LHDDVDAAEINFLSQNIFVFARGKGRKGVCVMHVSNTHADSIKSSLSITISKSTHNDILHNVVFYIIK